MVRRDPSDETLREALRARGYQPAQAELAPLLDRLGEVERAEAAPIERALERLGRAASEAARARFPESEPPLRGRLCRLIGRLAERDPEAREWLLARLTDSDAKTRRNTIIALGKLGGDGVEPALRARWPDEPLENRRSLAAALGKLGGPEARALLAAVDTDDPELARITGEALLKLDRTLGRARPGGIDPERAAGEPLAVIAHCRHGLAELLAGELEAFGAKVESEETVRATLKGPLGGLYRARTLLRFGFPLSIRAQKSHGLPEVGEAVVAALSSPRALTILRAFTSGPLRYRIEWASGGHRRGLTFRVAEALARDRPELLNDPTESLWEVVVSEPDSDAIRVELWPRGLPDPRFVYRRVHLPASSHPTIAAALALTAGSRPDDVVWDPFVGAGTELVERARLGPYRRLYGTDLDETALDRARENFAAAGLAGVTLAAADARSYAPPEPPTLILSNPPMGRRVLDRTRTGALFDAFLTHAAELLAPSGRLVFISPRPDDTVARARALGLTCTVRKRVDMGGFWAELQGFRRGRMQR